MQVIPAQFPWVGADMDTVLDAGRAQGLKDAGLSFVVRYLTSLTLGEVADILGSGLALSVVTYADQFDGGAAVATLQALGLPPGLTVWLDVEGIAPEVTPSTLIGEINAWAAALSAAGYMPGEYVGANSCLTSSELYALGVVRYWKGMSQLYDRNGMLIEPQCGWCLEQKYPTITIAGTKVDIDYVGYDYEGRLPMMATA